LAKLFERGAAFVKNVQPSDSVLLVHHIDADGYCAAAVLLHLLKARGVKNVKSVVSDVESLKKIVGGIKPGEFDKIIVLDIDAPLLKPAFERTKTDTLIVDHHMVRSNLNVGKITYVNPRLADSELYQPVSYVIYKIASLLADSESVEWLAALGSVADFAFEDCRDVLDRWIDANKVEDIVKSEFWKAAKVLYGAIIYANAEGSEITHEQLLDTLMSVGGVKELMSNPVVISADEKFEKEYERAKRDFVKNAETEGEVITGILDSRMKRLCSALSTNLSIEHKGKLIIILEKRGERFKISARWQNGRVHLGKLMEKCCHGGGHRNAAGGSIGVGEIESFKACLFRELGVK